MKIPYKVIEENVYIEATVQIPNEIFNKIPGYASSNNMNEGFFSANHVRPGVATRTFGDVSLIFKEQDDKLPIPLAVSNGIHVMPILNNTGSISAEDMFKKIIETPIQFLSSIEKLLQDFGFQKRTEARYYHPIFGKDSEENWMWFDPKTDQPHSIIYKLYHSGYAKGVQKVRFDIKKALDISLI